MEDKYTDKKIIKNFNFILDIVSKLWYNINIELIISSVSVIG